MQEPDAATIRKKMIGVLLRNARIRAGMTIKDASEATGFPPSAISHCRWSRSGTAVLTLPLRRGSRRYIGQSSAEAPSPEVSCPQAGPRRRRSA